MGKIPGKQIPEIIPEFVPLKKPMPNFGPMMRAAAAKGAAEAGVGRALEGVGRAFMRAQKLNAARQQATYDVHYYNLLGQLETDLRELARNAPEDGRGLSEAMGETFKRRTEEFLSKVPANLRAEYAARLARYQIKLEEATYKTEAALHDNALKRDISRIVQQRQIEVEKDPERLKEVESQTAAYIDSLDLPADVRESVKEAARAALQASAATGRILKLYVDGPIQTSIQHGDRIDEILARLHRAEGVGKSPTSSAAGHFQWTKGSWLSAVRRYYPHLFRTMSEEEILALRWNKTFAWDLTRRVTIDAMDEMASSGINPSPTAVRLAHFLGLGTFKRFARAAPDTPLEAVLPRNYFSANSFLRGKTVGWLWEWARKQMEGGSSTKGMSARGFAARSVNLFSDLDALTPQQRLSFIRQAHSFFRMSQDNLVNDIATQVARGEIAEPTKFIRNLLETGEIDGASFLRLNRIINGLESLGLDPETEGFISAMKQNREATFRAAGEAFKRGELSESQFEAIRRHYNLLKGIDKNAAVRDIYDRMQRGEDVLDAIEKLDVDPDVKVSLFKLYSVLKDIRVGNEADRLAELVAKGQIDRDALREMYEKGNISKDVFVEASRELDRIEKGMNLTPDEVRTIYAEALQRASQLGPDRPPLEQLLAETAERLGSKFTIQMATKITKAYREATEVQAYANPAVPVAWVDNVKKVADRWLDQSGLTQKLIVANGQEAIGLVRQFILPLAADGRQLPPKLGAIINEKLTSGDPAAVSTAVDMFAEIHAANPQAAKLMLPSETDYKRLFMLGLARAWGYTPQMLAELSRELTDPNRIASAGKKFFEEQERSKLWGREKADDHLRELITDNQLYLTPDERLRFEDEFYSYYSLAYRLFGDHDKAVETADRLIKSFWGKTELGDIDMLMTRLPPHLVAPNAGVLEEWMSNMLEPAVEDLKKKAPGEVLSVILTGDPQSVGRFMAGPHDAIVRYKLSALIEDPHGAITIYEYDKPIEFNIGKVEETLLNRIRNKRSDLSYLEKLFGKNVAINPEAPMRPNRKEQVEVPNAGNPDFIPPR